MERLDPAGQTLGMRMRTGVGGARRRWRMVLALLAVLLVSGWVTVAITYVARPRVDAVQSVDALYVIGPAEGGIADARRLMAEGTARTLVVTMTMDTRTGKVYPKDMCDPAAWEVVCVKPDPYTTRGEAAALARLATGHGWSRVAVMTDTSHVARTRLWMDRCVPVAVSVWASSERRTPLSWVGAVIYQSGAWVKAQIQRGCA